MPYNIREKGKKFEIVRKEDGKVVGISDTREKAERSIGYRMQGEAKKGRVSGATTS